MACPVHIWLPAMAALAPLGRMARNRLQDMQASRAQASTRARQTAAPRAEAVRPASK